MKKQFYLVASIIYTCSMYAMYRGDERAQQCYHNNLTILDYRDATDSIAKLLRDINFINADEKISCIKQILDDPKLSTNFSNKVKKYLIKKLRSQVYNYQTVQLTKNSIPHQLTTYFDGLQDSCSFFSEECHNIFADPNKSPWLELSWHDLLRRYCEIVHYKNLGKPYPRIFQN